MNITVNEVEFCKINVQYEADGDTIVSKKAEVVNKFRGQKVPGFRDGHVPLDAIKQHYRKEIKEALRQELAQEAVYNVIAEKNIKPFGRPTFSSVNLEDSGLIKINGEPAFPKFNCEFSMYIQPEFELNQYKDFEIPKASGIVPTEELHQKMLQELRTKYGNTIPFGPDDFVQMGDTVIIDMETSIDGNPIEEWTKSGDILNIGRIIIPGFSESTLGMKVGDEREFDLGMPENFPNFPGKIIHFKVKINMGSKSEPAALDDELAKKLGMNDFTTLDETIRSTASSRVKELEMAHNIDQISNRLVENHVFKVPNWISSAEAEINAKNAGQDWNEISDEEKTKFIDMAEKSIKLSLILQKIREAEPDAQLTDEEVFDVMKTNLSKFSQEPDKVLAEIYQNGHLPILINRIRDEHVLGFIEKKCKFVE